MRWLSFAIRFSIALMIVGSSVLTTGSGYAAGTIRHAVPNGGTAGDCSNMDWLSPCSLPYALSIAQPGDEVWVREGMYYPASSTNQTASFQLPNGVAVYGGFKGTETDRGKRHWGIYKTFLSGDLAGNDSGSAHWDNPTFADNSYHVVTATGASRATVLDGFIIQGGYAQGGSFGPFPDSGGGISLVSSSPTLENLVIAGNISDLEGSAGGLLLSDQKCMPTLTNILFTGNRAGSAGGAINNYEGSPVLTNVTFIGNHAEGRGGAIATRMGTMPVRNSIIWGNTASRDNSISIGITYVTIRDSDVEGGCPIGAPPDGCNATMLSVVPGFINTAGWDGIIGTADDNPRLRSNSALINQGSNTVADPALPALDLAGNTRIYQGLVDMGAYEWMGNAPPNTGNQVFYIHRDTTAEGQLRAIEPDGDPMIFLLVNGPASGSFVFRPEGSFTYSAAAGFTGAVSFRFTVTDNISEPVGPYTATLIVGYPLYIPTTWR